ncbi:MAG: hypothetical protein EBT20_22655 [Alphaproteobacteria bacterium]|nr:hypothetical protein [Alphaproteobacteria bacterium]
MEHRCDGFKTMKTAYATIKEFEVMRALRKDQRRAVNLTSDPIRGVIAVYLIICNRALFGEP